MCLVDCTYLKRKRSFSEVQSKGNEKGEGEGRVEEGREGTVVTMVLTWITMAVEKSKGTSVIWFLCFDYITP